jgi:arginase
MSAPTSSARPGTSPSTAQAVAIPTTGTSSVALVGLHFWTDDDYPNVARWGIRSLSPEDLRQSSEPLLNWLTATDCHSGGNTLRR